MYVCCIFSEKLNCESPNPHCEREKQELALLDDILAKAHHARDLQNKVIVTSLDRHYDYSRPGFNCIIKINKAVPMLGLCCFTVPKPLVKITQGHLGAAT